MKTKRLQHGGFTLVELLVVIVIIAALAGLSLPVIMKNKKAADKTEALSNIKQIGLSLFEFDTEYGSFPDSETGEDVKEATGTSLNFGGDYSNDYFRQMIAQGVKSEKIFWCKTAETSKKPDDILTPGKALAVGEVGYGYIMASQSRGQSSSGDPNRPVVVSPLYKAQPNWEFDPEPFGEKAIVLRLDSSARAETIRQDNRYVSIQGGRFLQTTGEATPWGADMNPSLKGPEVRGE